MQILSSCRTAFLHLIRPHFPSACLLASNTVLAAFDFQKILQNNEMLPGGSNIIVTTCGLVPDKVDALIAAHAHRPDAAKVDMVALL